MRRIRPRQSGFALLLVMMLVVFASTLGASVLMSSSVRVASAANMTQVARSRYLAEAGMEHATYLLRTTTGTLATSPTGPFTLDGTGDGYWFWGQPTAKSNEYVLSGRGKADGITQELSATVRLNNIYEQRLKALGPVAYWRMNDSMGWSCADEMASYNGIYVNGPTKGVEGALIGSDDKSVRFDGANDYANVGKVGLAGTKLTIVVWVRRSSPTTSSVDRIISRAVRLGGQELWSLGSYRRKGQRYLEFNVRTTKRSRRLRAKVSPLTVGAGVYDGKEMRLYVDGQQVAKTKQKNSLKTSKTGDAWIGVRPTTKIKYAWSGEIDDLAIFTKALSAEDLQMLYEARYPEVSWEAWNE